MSAGAIRPRVFEMALIADADDCAATLLLPVAPLNGPFGQYRRLGVERVKLVGFLVRELVLRGQGVPRSFNLGQRLRLFGWHRLRLAMLASVPAHRLKGRLGA
jgi:hypothetical protein